MRSKTNLEQKLIDNGWCLTTKRYIGKHSEKTLCYEYHKTADLRNDGKEYDQIIKLDTKRAKIVSYGIENVNIEYLDDDEILFIRTLYFQLDHFVQLLTKVETKQATYFDPHDSIRESQRQPMTFEQLDIENGEQNNE